MSDKSVAILQSNYIPWKGYFDLIAFVDEFIIYDDMQYTRRDWRNRNQIKTPNGLQWLTVPIKVKGNYHQTIREAGIEGSEWAEKHWQALKLNYSRSPYFDEIAAIFEPLYLRNNYTHLSVLNRELIEAVCIYLGITTKISDSHDYKLCDGKSQRLADLCVQAGGNVYVSGPAAKNYLDKEIFMQLGVELYWFDYSDYQEYPQLWGEFVHSVTILDLLFNCGKDAPRYMRYVLS